MAIYNASLLISASNATYFTNTTGGIAAVDVRGLNESWISSSALLTGSNTFVGNQIVTGSVTITGNVYAANLTGSTIATGSFATTGSNVFKGTQFLYSTDGAVPLQISSSAFYGIQLQNQGIQITGNGGPRIQFPNATWLNGNENDNFQFTGDTDNPLTRGIDFYLYGSGSRAMTFRNNSGPGATIQFSNNSGSISFNAYNNNISFAAGGQVSITGSQTYLNGLRYPQTDGTSGQALITNGAGTLSFGSVSINTGSFATTGSNTFNGIETINIPTGAAGWGIKMFNTGSDASGSMILGITDPGNPFIQLKNKTWFQFGANEELQYASFTSSFDKGIIIGPYYTATEKVRLMPRSSSLQFSQDIGSGEVPILTLGVPQGIGTTQPSIFNTNLVVNNAFTASLQQGYTWVGGAGNISTLVATSSFGGGISGQYATLGANTFTGSQTIQSGSLLSFGGFTGAGTNGISWGGGAASMYYTTGSINYLQIGNSNAGIDVQVNNTANTGSNLNFTNNAPNANIQFTANTGSINFIAPLTSSLINMRGVVTIGDTANTGLAYLLGRSGSLVLGNSVNGATYAALSHISSSQPNGNTNLIFKVNSNTPSTIVSGSTNIFANPAAATAGFNRYIGGAGNILLSTAATPQISGSMVFSPTMNNNYIVNGITLRGPVSSSTWAISNNIGIGSISIGSSAALNAEKVISGLNMSSNYVAGTFTLIANQSNLSGSIGVNANLSFGSTTLIASSSALNFNQNIVQTDQLSFTNAYYSGSLGIGAGAIATRNIFGGSAPTLTITGTQPAGTSTAPSINDNISVGGSHQLYVDTTNSRVVGTTAYNGLLRTALLGQALTVSGSSLLTDTGSYGSAFVGRYNAVDGRRENSANNVFVVGTGNGFAGRKTGFLIDSGSNTFVEGTFNVSGSSSLTGSLAVSSYAILSSVSSSLNFADDTAAAAGGVPLGGLYRNGNFVMIRLT